MNDVTLYLGDCLEVVPTLPAASVDAIITDVPYGTTACSWDEVIPFDAMWAIVKHVLKPRGVFVTTASQPFTSKLVMSNLEWFKYEMVWDKVNKYTDFMNANHRPMKRHENILVFSRSGHTYNPQMENIPEYKTRRTKAHKVEFTHAGISTADFGNYKDTKNPSTVLCVPARQTITRDHPTQKPVALYEYLIRTYTNPGDTVLDFCMGSGTTGVACVNTGRNFIGVELREDYYQIAQRRIAEAQLQPRLFVEEPAKQEVNQLELINA